MTVYELQAKLGLDSSEYEAGLKKAGQESTTFGSMLKANLVSKGIELVISGLMKASKALIEFGTAAVQTGAQFDSAMSQVAATMGVTVDEIQNLRQYAQEMGATTAFSATQAAEALNYMALAGYDAETAMAMLPNVLNLAAAGGMDLATASDMVTDAQSALGLSLSQTNTMVDQMAATASKSNTSVSQLGEAFLTIGATARNLAGGTQELATVLGVLADNGIKGAEGGTHLRNMILSLQSPTSDAQAILDDFSISLYDSNGNMRSMIDIIADLQVSMEGMDQASKDAVIGGIFNKTDLAAVNALLGTSQERFAELGSAIENAAGAAQKMADTQLDNLNGDITLMNSALEGVKIQFSDGITPAIRNVVQTITGVLSKQSTMKYINELGKKLGELTKTITGKVATAIPKIVNNIETIGKVAVVAAGAISGLALAMEATVNPVGAAVKGLAAFAAVAGTVALTTESVGERLGGLTREQRNNISATLDSIEAYKQSKESRNKTIAGIEQETQKTSELWTELQSLADENGNVAEKDREHAQILINQLNDALGTELQLVDGQIQSYNSLAAAIENALAKKKAEAMYEAVAQSAQQAEANMSGIQSAIYDQETEIANLQEQYVFWQQKLDEVAAATDGDIEKQTALTNQYEATRDAIGAAIDTATEKLGELKDAENEAYADMALADAAYTELLKGNYDQVAEIISNDTVKRYQHMVETGNISQQELSNLERDASVAASATLRYYDQLQKGAEGYTEKGLEEMIKTADELINTYMEALKQSETDIDEADPDIDIESNTEEEAEKARALADAIRSIPAYRKVVVEYEEKTKSSSDDGGGGGTSRAIGMDYVPTNNYEAILHKGEAVLTASEADDWRRGESGQKGFDPNVAAILELLEEIVDNGLTAVVDGKSLYKSVRSQNKTRTTATNYNALAMA